MVYELRCVPVVLATVSAIDGCGFSFNYVGCGNTTDNTFQSLYDFLLRIMSYVIYTYTYTYTYTHIDLYNSYDDLMVCGIVTSSTVTTSLRSVIDTPVASNMVINLWALTPRQRLRTMMMYYISRYVYIYIYIYIYISL